MNVAILLMCLASAQTRAVKPQEGPAPRPDKASMKPKSGAPLWTARGGVEFSYDDNFLELSNKQIAQLKDGTEPGKFRIDDPADFVTAPWAEIKVKGFLFREPTSAGLKLQPYFHQDSSIANYEEYELFVKQDLGAHEAGVDFGWERDVYLRELNLPGPNNWGSAFYEEYDLELYYKHRVHPNATLKGSLGWLVRDFESPFGFRDRAGYYLALQPAVDLGKGWKAYLRYEYSDQEADAGALDPDTSYRQHEVELGVSVELVAKVLELSLGYRAGWRDYTTSNDPAVDPSHAEREDERRRLVLEIGARLSKSWSLEARYERREVDSHRPHDDDATTSEPGDSERDLFTLGVTFSL